MSHIYVIIKVHKKVGDFLEKIIETLAYDIAFIHTITGMKLEDVKGQVVSSLKEEDEIELSELELKKLDKEIESALEELK